MCGIAGYFEKKIFQVLKIKNIAKNIIAKLYHRADHEGMLFLENHGITFLHSRLAIIDLSADANQPITSNSKRYIITYNGEIYNYLQLKEELIQQGHKFNTSSILRFC